MRRFWVRIYVDDGKVENTVTDRMEALYEAVTSLVSFLGDEKVRKIEIIIERVDEE